MRAKIYFVGLTGEVRLHQLHEDRLKEASKQVKRDNLFQAYGIKAKVLNETRVCR